ncbi:TonB-dependent receptor [Sphingobacterium chuzhouense]|uniref:TonB-dependent receptor n=1 Tax=Sphingobacterium chuzhouense TaxID=1742264 RepID=A0ABR7XXH8_9SPHI|nr:TonB-dependent receptor [Sphingobacterium chuzhouense]MBD1423732.1 TonB-dependent receptor [Sphingobacterium chuzhouense]
MKLIPLLLLSTCLHLSATSVSQTITLRAKNKPITAIFEQIEKQSGHNIIYNDRFVDAKTVVSIHVQDKPLAEVLSMLLSPRSLSFIIKDKTIAIRQAEKARSDRRIISTSAARQQRTVQGTVTGASGNPLEGATVQVKQTGRATMSNAAGAYEIQVPEGAVTLAFSLIGYQPQEQVVGDRTTVHATLTEAIGDLDEVVVIGYGTQRKSSLTAAVSTVKMEDIRNIPRPNILQSLAGRVPGVTVAESNGEPGSSPEILVRGIGTIEGNNNGPLVLVDGSPATNLSSIAPADIESISVLKDAAAAAIYGSRAANGVLLVTTKRGGEMDRAVIEFNSYAGIQTPTRFPKTVTSYEFATLVNEAMFNENKAPIYNENDLRLFREGTDPVMHANTNWLEEVTDKHVPIVNNYLSASGNSAIGQYFLSGEYMHQKGSIKHIDHYNRVNLRGNITSKISDKLQLQMLTSYQHTTRDAAGVMNIFSNALRNSPTAAVRYPNGYYGGAMFANGNYLWRVGNQVQVIENYGPIDDIRSNYTVNGNLEYKPVAGLTLKGMAVYHAGHDTYSAYQPKMETYDFFERTVEVGRNSLTENWSKRNKYDLQATATYEKRFGAHYLNLLGGYSQESFREDRITAYRADFINDELHELSAGDAATQTNGGGADHWAFMSGFGRLSYNFDERYLFELTGRYDGSSRLAAGNRWDFFPSVSAGWNIRNESFMQHVGWLDLLKLRASVGQLGNAEKLGFYEPYPRLSVGPYYSFNDTQVLGVLYGNPANPNLSWETSTTYNLGLDASIKNGLFGFEFDLWEKRTDDILLTVPVSNIIGLPQAHMTTNAGKVGSHGFDLVLTHNHFINDDFSYNAAFTISGWRSWVIDLQDRATPFSSTYRPNGDLGDYYGYQTMGIINTEEQLANYRNLDGVPPQIGLGDLMYKDQNGDGKLDYMDQVRIGNRYVKTQFGLNLGFRYKTFDLAVLLQGAGNTDRVWDGYVRNALMNFNSPLALHLDRWSPENPNANALVPRLLQNFAHNRENSDWWIKSGSYLRLKNVQVGYSLPTNALSKIKIQGLRAYLAATNLFTYAPNYVDGFDPERDIFDQWYPNYTVVSLGLNLRL